MKTHLITPRVALVALALATAGMTATFADTTTAPSTTTTSTTPAPTCKAGGWKHHKGMSNVLTDAEKAQIKKAYQTALATNPSLKTDQENLKQQFKALRASGTATADQKDALHQQARDLRKKIHAAELAADPTLVTVFAKLKAAHKDHHSQA